MKSRATALFLSVFVGVLGVDRFYLGYTGMGILKLLTGGCFGILYILDILSIANGTLSPADGTAYTDEIMPTKQQRPKKQSEIYDRLKSAHELHNKGALTDAEFAQIKASLLSDI